MSKLTLADIAKAMRDIDICMLTTKDSEKGGLESRPMSNNKDVDYDGDSYYFASGDSTVVKQLEADAHVCVSMQHQPTLGSLLGKSTYLCITGKAHLIRDKAELKKHWNKDLDKWFKDGIDTPGLTLIHASAEHIKYWHNYEEGEIHLSPKAKAA